MAAVNLPDVQEHVEHRCADSLVPSLDDLLSSDPDEFVGRHTDIGAVNLACARGLPNCEESEFTEYLTLLDTIAEAVERETERSRRLFKIKPAQFHNSETVFHLYTMEHVFRTRFNIRYDRKVKELIEKGRRWETSDSSEVFIHGILGEKRTGTCSSLPTFAIAVGRRLGYPLKLVLVPNHTLYRWDDGKNAFNFQHTEVGGDIHEDEYFHKWPREWTHEDFALNERTKIWLHSMNPRQETSKFLCNRAIMLREQGRCDEAFQAIDAARRFNPNNPACASIREDIEWTVHKPRHGLTPFPFGAILPLPGSINPTTLLEMATRLAHSQGPSPYGPSPSMIHPHGPNPPATLPFADGPSPHAAQPPYPGPVDPRTLIELAKSLVHHAQSHPAKPLTSPPLAANLQTFVGTVGLNMEHPRPQ